MHPVVIQIVHVPHDRKCPGSRREVGRPSTVSDIACSQDENCSEEEQRAGVPVHMEPTYRNHQAHSGSWVRVCGYTKRLLLSPPLMETWDGALGSATKTNKNNQSWPKVCNSPIQVVMQHFLNQPQSTSQVHTNNKYTVCIVVKTNKQKPISFVIN